ncbi:HEAT repeat protein-like protein [Cucurbitaria berberidis CBS 394.84]|uniref:HEAT repeat protein-like protein n=1 Tax=Cucurbitaria berberidis CBS 394.84 TaxID=1168544 RepID=A0A9P4L7F8_9PLEO|nr:HEAT repeat protein-like protein [Cucurbitaria berberidis CBS 394.84]KAF1844910.1 HEAT repeat protein-like protein [Cucurbitaria berberidis CBS 394.84]
MAADEQPANESPSNPELDIKKLHALPSEQQDLYLLTFTSDLARHVASLDADGASAHQIYIKKEIFQIINLASPAPTRLIRNNLGRAIAGIFEKGDRKLLFESINECVGIINAAGKSEKDVRTKHAATHCLGAIFEAAGDSAIGLSPFAAKSLLGLVKFAQNYTGLRAAIFKAVGKVFKGVSPSADEVIARDACKQARNACSDKSYLVQTSACYCLEQLIRHTTFFDNSNDFDKLQSVAWKTIDSASSSVRHAVASVVSAAIVKNYSENAPVDLPVLIRSKTMKKKNKKDDDGDEDTMERPDSPALKKSATQLSFTITSLLRLLSMQYCRPAAGNRARAGIAVCYMKTLRGLGEQVVETKYPEIARSLFVDVLSNHVVYQNRYRLLSTRKYVAVILETVIGRDMLGESGQLSAAKFLVNEILKDYPQALKERPEPSKQTLIGALSTLSSLFNSLGSATNVIADSCRDALLQVLQHPSYTVQVTASTCLRAFVLACPLQLLPAVTICMNSVNRELGLLAGPRQSPRKCVGLANGLSAVLSTSTSQPLHGSVDVNSRVLSQATSLLKSASNSDLRISSTQIQVAWILIGGLMTLGPNFVKIHLSQLLLLWKNALPKPLNKDNMVQRNFLELSFLAHVRECALGSILTFLVFNSRLLTLDVTKRLAAMLQNTTMFLNTLPAKKITDDISQRLSPALQLHDFDLMVRRRVLQCYTKLVELSPASSNEVLLQTNLLPFAIASFAEPDNYTTSSFSTTIASAAGTFESIWEVADNHGFGVTGLVRGFDIKPLPGEHETESRHHWLTRHGPEDIIDRTLLSPICGAREHDSISLYIRPSNDATELPDPPATEVVNAALQLFAICLPLQTPRIQESILEQMTSFLSASSLQRDINRKTAMMVNIAYAILSTLKVAVKETRSASGSLKGPAVEKVMQDLLHLFIILPDPYVRNLAGEALGRLCNSSGNSLTTNEVNYLVDQIVANREPNARSGYAVALGCIHSQLGGMAAGFHLKNILGILMSLGNDPHPVVHFWAIDSLSRVADSAGLSFSSYVTSTLGMLAQLYAADTHNDESASLASSNIEIDVPTPAVIARCIDSTINVLGPDLQDVAKARDLILTLVGLFQGEADELVVIEGLRCQEHISLYVPGHMDFSAYVKHLQRSVESSSTQIRDMAIDGLHNLMRRNTEEVIRSADLGLEDQLWHVLDRDSEHEVVRNIIRNWLHQTGLSDTATWVQRCHSVLTKTKKVDAQDLAETKPKAGATDLQDEEVAGFAAASNAPGAESGDARQTSQELLKWQVRTFGMDCLSELVAMVGKEATFRAESPCVMALQQRVADVVRIAFSASTAGVVQLRIRGLKIIDQVLKLFGKTPDPDFAEVTLLEQYQAQIGSALTPAFAADSSPELAAEAVNVCATFIATGIVTDVDRMGRILKLLVTALENFSSETETAAIGDLKGLSSNAQVMVKMAVFSAWAELQIASTEQTYLVDVLKPHIAKLTPLWLASLREYARLRFEPDISSSMGGSASLSGSLDTIYAALNRETLLKFYQESWLNLVDAIASLIDEDSEFVFDALDGKTEFDESTPNGKADHINYRDEPVAFFFVLFGLAFEALAGRPGDLQASKEQILEILQALKKILRPSVSGHAIYQEVVFSETMDMLDRLVLTEGLTVQTVIVEITRNLCLGHPSARREQRTSSADENLSDDIDQLFELTKIMVLVLSGLVPGLEDSNTKARHEMNEEAVALLTTALSALVDAAQVFPSIIKADLHACILHIFATILGTGTCQATVVPKALPIFKRFVTSLAPDAEATDDTSKQLRATLTRFLAILKHAQHREFDAALVCEKNTILATTILLSSAASSFSPSDPLMKRFVDDLFDCLGNRMTSKVAAGCCRSLLLLPKKGALEMSLAKMMLPQILTSLANPSDVEGLEESRTTLASTLVAFISTLPKPEQRQIAAKVIIPALLSRAEKEPKATAETATRLLEVAGADQIAFRSVVAGLSADQRTFMESVLKSGQGPARREVSRDDDGQPKIALKMDFGA